MLYLFIFHLCAVICSNWWSHCRLIFLWRFICYSSPISWRKQGARWRTEPKCHILVFYFPQVCWALFFCLWDNILSLGDPFFVSCDFIHILSFEYIEYIELFHVIIYCLYSSWVSRVLHSREISHIPISLYLLYRTSINSLWMHNN